MRGCRKCELYLRPDMEREKCILCNSDIEEITGNVKCNGGCGQIRPVYKWMQAAFDSPYPYCEECFPLNWTPIDNGGGYLLIERPQFWKKYIEELK